MINEIFINDVNNDVDYKIFLIAKNKKTKKLKIKYKYEIIAIRNKELQISIRNKKIALFLRRKRIYKTFENDFDQFEFFFEFLFETKIFKFKKQRLFLVFKLINFNNYVDKNFKKY